jgi:predicted GIY-YIG superfamily endonuclease
MLRDKLTSRLRQMGDSPDYPLLAAEVLGIRNAPQELARRLVEQALVVEDRRDAWRQAGARIAARAPARPGVYVLTDAGGDPLYVGKANNLRRRLRAHFSTRRWRALKADMARAAGAEWTIVGSELEALLREAALIDELRPPVNVQIGPPTLDTRAIPTGLIRDVIVVLPSVEEDSAELVAARPDGEWMIQRTRRSGADLMVHVTRVLRFLRSPLRPPPAPPSLAPIVFSWLAGRGAGATRLDPHDARSPRELRARLAAVLRDERLFRERLDQRATV